MDQRLPEPAGAAPLDWRGLCEELAEPLERWVKLGTGPDYETWSENRRIEELIDRARAALAQPEPEVAGPSDGPAVPNGREPASVVGEPSDEELLELAQYHSISYTMSDGTVVYPLQEGCDMRDDVLSFARAVLARHGRPAPAPAGEVGEFTDEEWEALVDRLWDQYETVGYQGERFMYEGDFSTALDLVRQKIARFGRPAPVSAGEVGEPPAELVEQWMREASNQPPGPDARVIAALAARWGAAQVTERQAAPVPAGEVG